MKGASPNQQKHSAAIREGVEKLKQRLEEADCDIHVREERLQAACDEVDFWLTSICLGLRCSWPALHSGPVGWLTRAG